MKAIIKNKMYDTEKAIFIFNYLRKETKPCFWNNNLVYKYYRKVDMYKTNKEQYFLHIHAKEDLKERIELITKYEAKDIISRLDPEKYIELFGEVEEG